MLLCVIISSCSDCKKNKYVEQVRSQLKTYDSVTLVLIAKYSKYSLGGGFTVVYPSAQPNHNDGYRVFDYSINDFCAQNDISRIEVQPTAENKANVTYYLSDPNCRYIYNGYNKFHQETFENTKVRVVSINEKWTFLYEKPNF